MNQSEKLGNENVRVRFLQAAKCKIAKFSKAEHLWATASECLPNL